MSGKGNQSIDSPLSFSKSSIKVRITFKHCLISKISTHNRTIQIYILRHWHNLLRTQPLDSQPLIWNPDSSFYQKGGPHKFIHNLWASISLFICRVHHKEMLDWMKHNLESRVPGEISITSDMQMTPPLWQKVKRNSKAS